MGCFAANKDGGDDFMDWCSHFDRSAFFAFRHLLYKQLHCFGRKKLGLLGDGADGDDCFGGNGRTVKAHNLIGVRQGTKPLYQKIQQDVCMGVVGHKYAFALVGIFFFQLVDNLRDLRPVFFKSVAQIGQYQFMAQVMLLTDIAKSSDTSICRDILRKTAIDMD